MPTLEKDYFDQDGSACEVSTSATGALIQGWVQRAHIIYGTLSRRRLGQPKKSTNLPLSVPRGAGRCRLVMSMAWSIDFHETAAAAWPYHILLLHFNYVFVRLIVCIHYASNDLWLFMQKRNEKATLLYDTFSLLVTVPTNWNYVQRHLWCVLSYFNHWLLLSLSTYLANAAVIHFI